VGSAGAVAMPLLQLFTDKMTASNLFYTALQMLTITSQQKLAQTFLPLKQVLSLMGQNDS